MDDRDADEADEKAVVPESVEARGVCPMPPGYGFMELALGAMVGAVWVRARVGPWDARSIVERDMKKTV